MSKHFRNIRIFEDDYNWLIRDFDEDYYRHYPEMKNIKLSFAFKIHKMRQLWERTP